MKRRQTASFDTASKDEEVLPVAKIAKVSGTSPHDRKTDTQTLNKIDVQSFLLMDCQALSKKLVEQAKMQADELRRELEIGKQVLLDALQAEKENVHKDSTIIPQAFSIAVRSVTGPYCGKKFSMAIDVKRHSSCFVGRSTGRKFRPPRGLSLPKDSELSTTHGEIKMETSGKLFFIDLDSTNGTRIDNVALIPCEPYVLTLHKPIKIEIGAGEYEFVFEET